MLERIDRRFIYLFVALSLAIPLKIDVALPPAHMKTADSFYQTLETLERRDDKIVLIAMDWGPSTQAENRPQTAVVLEHLLRKRIPFALISITPYAVPYLESLPQEIIQKIQTELPQEKWEYGVDWVNLGFQPGGTIMIQSFAKATDLHEVLRTDATGTPLSEIACFKKIKTLENISTLIEITGLVSAFNYWIQFFQSAEYRPAVLHGCTSITIPEAYIYYASKQIVGLHEGVAGAAWYEKLLSDHYPSRKTGEALKTNTSLAVGHTLILILILLGNIGMIRRKATQQE